MSERELTIEEVRSRGHAALLRGLGPADNLRFMQLYVGQAGDYTAERHRWLDKVSMEDVGARLEERRPGTRR